MKEEMSLHEWIYNYIEEAIRFGISVREKSSQLFHSLLNDFRFPGVPSFMPLSSWRNITT